MQEIIIHVTAIIMAGQTHKMEMSKVTSSPATTSHSGLQRPRIPRSRALVGYRLSNSTPRAWPRDKGKELCLQKQNSSCFLDSFILNGEDLLRVKGSAMELLCFDFTQKLTRRAVPEPLLVGNRTAHLIPLT